LPNFNLSPFDEKGLFYFTSCHGDSQTGNSLLENS
jgi:hypothetical protein